MMQRYELMGCKGYKGDVDGVHYDSCTLYVKMPVSKRSGNEAGFDAMKVKYGKEEEYQKLKGLPFPVMVDLDLEINTKGVECFDLKLVQTPNQKQAA